jgi:anti-sigma regulatory factor (Ser/Thr protein kinase)
VQRRTDALAGRRINGLNLSSKRGSLLRIQILSNPKVLGVVRGVVERLAEVVGFSAPDCRSVVRAVDEALSNVMRHCYCGRTDRPIELRFTQTGSQPEGQLRQGLQIEIRDHGPAVDQSKWKRTRPGRLKPGGLGLHLIRQAMDTVEYKRIGQTNRLLLVKYLPQTRRHFQA